MDKELIGTIDSGDEVYTKVEVHEDETDTETAFSIFWLVPDNAYILKIEMDAILIDEIAVEAASLGRGRTHDVGSI